MRARYPDTEGYVERDGVRIYFEIYGDGEPTIMLFPGWALPARSWKAQIPYLSRHFRVLAFDPRGTGRSDRPRGAEAYALAEHAADAIAVMDATNTQSAVLVGKSRGAQTALALVDENPDRVRALVVAAPFVPLSPWPPADSLWTEFEEPSMPKRRRRALRTSLGAFGLLARSESLRRFSRRVGPLEGARMFSRQTMLENFAGFALWFVTNVVVNDPFATKQTDDAIAWLTDTGAEAAADSFMGPCARDLSAARTLCAGVSCPVLVIHGEHDLTVPLEWGIQFAELTNGRLMIVPRAGHLPGGRYPVLVNVALREFVESLSPADTTVDVGAIAR